MENLNETSTKKFKREKYLANEAKKKQFNIRHDILMPNEVFTFITRNNVKLDAVCIKRIGHQYIDESDIVDNIFLCYSQNRLFKLHEIYNIESKEYRIRDFNQTLVDYCIIPEYDKKLKEYAEHNFFYGGAE
jgi:hypothetical protein